METVMGDCMMEIGVVVVGAKEVIDLVIGPE
jgi:hypothetical protein